MEGLMKKLLGKLTRVELREYCADEAREFTPWLGQEKNLQMVGRVHSYQL